MEGNVQVTALNHLQFCVLRYPPVRICSLGIFLLRSCYLHPTAASGQKQQSEGCTLKELMCWNGPWAPALGSIPRAFMPYPRGSSFSETDWTAWLLLAMPFCSWLKSETRDQLISKFHISLKCLCQYELKLLLIISQAWNFKCNSNVIHLVIFLP